MRLYANVDCSTHRASIAFVIAMRTGVIFGNYSSQIRSGQRTWANVAIHRFTAAPIKNLIPERAAYMA